MSAIVPRAGVLLLALACTAAAPAPAATTRITAGNCVAIAPDAHAGRDITIRVSCSSSARRKYLEDMGLDEWKVHDCEYSAPASGWLIEHGERPDSARDWRVIPAAGHPFGQFDLQLLVGYLDVYEDERVFLYLHNWPAAKAEFPSMTRERYVRIDAVRRLYPEQKSAISNDVVELIYRHEPLPAAASRLSRNRVASFIARHRSPLFGEGRAVLRNRISVMREEDQYAARLTLVGPEDYEQDPEDVPRPFERGLACVADTGIDLARFVDVCAMWMERQGLDVSEACLRGESEPSDDE